MDWQGEMRLAHMDKGLAERILALRPDEVRLMLADVLEPWALTPCASGWSRPSSSSARTWSKTPTAAAIWTT